MRTYQERTFRKLHKSQLKIPTPYISELVQNMTKTKFLTNITGQRTFGYCIYFRYKYEKYQYKFITMISIQTDTLSYLNFNFNFISGVYINNSLSK